MWTHYKWTHYLSDIGQIGQAQKGNVNNKEKEYTKYDGNILEKKKVKKALKNERKGKA